MDWFAFFQLILAAVLVWQAITYDLLPNWWRTLLFALAVVNFGFAFV